MDMIEALDEVERLRAESREALHMLAYYDSVIDRCPMCDAGRDEDDVMEHDDDCEALTLLARLDPEEKT